ncbi:hypothetical protein KUTeg_004673 [Tegillarca granosa]|uniref:Uncharacterized protein n=1 Tax=Tegillarca granosa TaxID=220873 RepID=A0ABQ9FKI5_TEGGR|nr:hypothetical protein KUTeg_004673 [Tegillarca granosa]
MSSKDLLVLFKTEDLQISVSVFRSNILKLITNNVCPLSFVSKLAIHRLKTKATIYIIIDTVPVCNVKDWCIKRRVGLKYKKIIVVVSELCGSPSVNFAGAFFFLGVPSGFVVTSPLAVSSVGFFFRFLTGFLPSVSPDFGERGGNFFAFAFVSVSAMLSMYRQRNNVVGHKIFYRLKKKLMGETKYRTTTEHFLPGLHFFTLTIKTEGTMAGAPNF